MGTPLAPLPDGESNDENGHVFSRMSTIAEIEQDSGTETLRDSDSEQDDQDQGNHHEDINDLVGWNVSCIFKFGSRL